ncbi:unnamed protein product [Brassica oleracea var. botrytis]|uniref:Uncharacterized protein n=4 Tax=Brassica TaxID=3705 RepID=A0A8S9RLN2_BRACR|nr:hypothetical protein DY000_02052654 [Brassica cretica]KAF3573232.1 hypothetical protein F2Q69_00058649 [Brassica cretica]CAF2106631.1 unnamed protein product [Brassica napus]CDY67713.1 BnaC08g46200D [Brassica napus]VDD54330.1 unnamed protein product [Brassica oleracea]
MKSTSLTAETTLKVTLKADGGGSRIEIGNPNLSELPELVGVAGDRRLGGLPP